MELSEIIKNYRSTNHLTMQELADACGLSKAYISMLEKGVQPRSHKKIVPSIETIAKVASAMGISVNTLVEQLDPNQRISLTNDPITTISRATNNNDNISQVKLELIDVVENLSDSEAAILLASLKSALGKQK